ncbi:hypothetical protein ACWES4_06780 [Streptomyces sp. NPDC004011]
MRLAERCGLPKLAGEHVRLPASKDGTGAFPAAKLMSLVGGMAAGADSIDDMDRLRHGAMGRLFTGVRAPSTLGSFLRSFTHGHVKQVHTEGRRFLHELAGHTPLLPGADQAAYVDIDDTIRRTHGYAKQGAGYGYSKVKGLRRQRPAGAAGGLRVPRRRRHQRLPGPGCPLLHHHADERLCQGPHRSHGRGRLDTDQISPSGLRR